LIQGSKGSYYTDSPACPSIREKVNHQAVGPRELVQFGGRFFGNSVVIFATRFPFFK